MVMDDEPDIRDLYKINLDKLGYEVVLVDCGEAAIERYQESLAKLDPIDIVILDLKVAGGMGGEETAEKLLDLNKNVVLVVSSGNSFGEVMENYKDYGFRGAIEKNFNRDKLKEVLDSI